MLGGIGRAKSASSAMLGPIANILARRIRENGGTITEQNIIIENGLMNIPKMPL